MNDDNNDRSRLDKIGQEIKSHAAGYIVLAGFSLTGLAISHFVFPEMSIWIGVVGGLAFGVYAALFAVPDKFL
ncbi:MAG: hypothetical protein JRC77_07275 [Deltaproteobacteria bacterium]|nr:hypothetical protein [Deltaproteobacteria bacterium]